MRNRIFVFFLAGAIFLSGCGLLNSGERHDPNELRVGMLTNLNMSENAQAFLIKQAGMRGGIPANQYPVSIYYASLNALQNGLGTGVVDVISTYDCVADYLLVRNPQYELTNFYKAGLADHFCLAVRDDDTALLSFLNETINAMWADDTLERLVKENIENMRGGLEPLPAEFASFPGNDTLKVAVTGDLPPIDLVLENGTPAGFNTAFLAELGRRMKKNIKLLRVESGDRASVLTNKNADVVFWSAIPAENFATRAPDLDHSLGIKTTVPYYEDTIVHIRWRK